MGFVQAEAIVKNAIRVREKRTSGFYIPSSGHLRSLLGRKILELALLVLRFYSRGSSEPGSESGREKTEVILSRNLKAALLIFAVLPLVSCSENSCADQPDAAEDSAEGQKVVQDVPLLVEIAYGPVRGMVADSSRVFRGIRYAAAPVGQLRFAAPQPPDPWSEPPVPEATICPQIYLEAMIGAEDCLTLDVWAPIQRPERPLPVMVWIHGGGFTSASGYLADAFLSTRGVIVVAINYRLGPLGFLAHPALTEEGNGTSGNYGIEDQRFALEWVRDNIEAFGGDPDNVTIFGESAGGAAVSCHIWSQRSAGLFHRAIMQSGNNFGHGASTLAEAEAQGERLAEAVCDSDSNVTECLRGLSPNELLDASSAVLGFSWRPCFDGVVFEREFSEAVDQGAINLVPTMVGSNMYEGQSFMTEPANLTEAQYVDQVRLQYGENADRVLSLYTVSEYLTPQLTLAAIRSHRSFNCTARRAARKLTDAGAEVYLYYFSYGWAFHAAELQLLFGVGALPPDQLVSAALKDYWTQFAKTGDPNGGELPNWPRYQPDSDRHLEITDPIAAGSYLFHEECDLWDTL